MPLGLGLQLGLDRTGRTYGEETDDRSLLLQDNSFFLLEDGEELTL